MSKGTSCQSVVCLHHILQACDLISTGSIFGKRNIRSRESVQCERCCREDLCNSYCYTKTTEIPNAQTTEVTIIQTTEFLTVKTTKVTNAYRNGTYEIVLYQK